MSVRSNMARVAATIPAALLAAPAMASEGTGESFGVDSPLLLLPLIGIPVRLRSGFRPSLFSVLCPWMDQQRQGDSHVACLPHG
jgi:hypothetical protein